MALRRDRITVALSGQRSRRRRRRGSRDGIVRLLSVGAIVPRKGYDVLDRGAADADRFAVAA